MNLSLRRTTLRLTAATLLLTGLAGGAAATVGVALAPTTAGATDTPPWEPDASSVGGLTFYDSSGNVITSGSTASGGLGAYVEGSATVRSGDTKATLFAYTPVSGQSPGQWSGSQLSLSTTYPNTGAHPPLNTSTLPVVTGPDGNTSLASYIALFPNTGTGTYAGLYQLRLKTSGTGRSFTTTYDSADISVSGSTWTLVYPPPSTTPTVTASVTPTASVHGQSVTYSATVTGSLGTATGSVAFTTVGSTTLCTATLSDGSGSCTAANAPVGTDTVTGTYTPGATYSSASGTTSLTVSKASTTTALVSSVNPSVYGQAVTFTATVTATAPGGGTPTGTVTFKDGGTTLGTGNLNGSGVATYQTSTLSVAGSPHSVTAVYGGDGNDTTSTSSAVSQAVSKASTTTAVSAAPNPSATGTAVTFTATVSPTSPGGGVPTGTVQFAVDGTNVGSPVALSAGQATYQTSSITVVGSPHSVTATYGGDANDNGSVGTLAGGQTVATAPGAPTGAGAVAANTAATVTFTAPASDGGAGITGYTVTATDATTPANGGQTATGPGSPITVPGLTNGDHYTFTVTATNGVGLTGPASDPSNSVVPAPPAPPAPPSGATSSEQATSSSPSGTATATLPDNSASATGTGAGSFTVAQYGGNPTSGGISGDNGGFFDLAVAPDSQFSSVAFTVCVPNVTSLSWWNGSGWVPFSNQTASGGCVTATVTDSTTPSFGDLTGTPVVALTNPVAGSGYDLVGSDGGVFVFPTGQSGGFYGSLPQLGVHVDNVVGMVPTADDHGYFLVGRDGGVFAFGDAPFEGSLPQLGVHVDDIVGIVPSSDDHGYFLVGADGGVFAFGDATFEGSLPQLGISTSSIVGIASTPDNHGYWVVQSDGAVFSFGSASFYGSASSPSPISGIAGTPDGQGYWLVSQNGSVYAYGNAQNYGTLPGLGVTPNKPVIGIVPTADQKGYWLIGADGGVFAFGDAPSVGSLPGLGLAVSNIVGAVPTKS
ncbi:MAG TPA: Ig-like domain repeat protein [Acidimicrobiales bacterium]|nr:Ig-like domain repeat protein [Acidimicrobiales bacterium]